MSHFFASLLKVKTKVQLVPVSDLIKIEHTKWESTGNDPAFILKGTVYKGWNNIQWESKADQYIPLKLYWDDGSGFQEENSCSMSAISVEGGKQYVTLFIPPYAQTLRLDPGEEKTQFEISDLEFKKVNKLYIALKSVKNVFKQKGNSWSTISFLVKKSMKLYRQQGLKEVWEKTKNKSGVFNQHSVQSIDQDRYKLWTASALYSRKNLENKLDSLNYKPLISIIVPVYNVEEIWLRKCIDSVLAQVYPHWELCIVDDNSTKLHIKHILNEYANKDTRIKPIFREKNGHISQASNSGLEASKGEFIALLDHDDELAENALLENVLVLNRSPEADVVYSDEDKISIQGERFSPFFKPDWSPDTLLSQMYTSHLTVYRKSLVEEVGSFRIGLEGSQDYDLMLRVSEKTNEIYHIPKILYHWRAIPESTASSNSSKDYTQNSGLKALEDALIRRNANAWVENVEDAFNLYRVHYRTEQEPLISIIIPNKNMTDTLSTCLNSIFEKTLYTNFEIIIVDNGSTESSTKELYQYWSTKEPNRFKSYDYDIPFNYSKLNNFGCNKANGELFLFLNNDVEIVTPDWLGEMAGQAIRSEIGAVGANLHYPDQTVQHAGVVLSLGGVAGHSHKHYLATDPGYFRRLQMVCNYSAVTAACLMIRKEVCEEIGGFNDSLQVAFNDIDFCLEVRKKGYWNIWLPQVQLIHYESKSRGYEDTPEKQARFTNEVMYMKNKWPEELLEDPFYNPNLTKDREDYSLGNPYID
ncbi:glycosyltransferase family 2 protein [Paenibacillus sp. PK4536]|uniref:glycosyltransferase family 2 protein n=1 Tax=Paenibacillus sp. PK4536 TaxID=3024576 RepID=UPI0023582A3A|nr:glycosyltransferase family 2 protein [Paenibacillus sp. PK4536]WIM39764.1 glycosyltransferase family 2 protein [Paenibacillus sp. PK4536]